MSNYFQTFFNFPSFLVWFSISLTLLCVQPIKSDVTARTFKIALGGHVHLRCHNEEPGYVYWSHKGRRVEGRCDTCPIWEHIDPLSGRAELFVSPYTRHDFGKYSCVRREGMNLTELMSISLTQLNQGRCHTNIFSS